MEKSHGGGQDLHRVVDSVKKKKETSSAFYPVLMSEWKIPEEI
jgi:hypothetical protein